jgi:hypothetical protein
MKLLTVDFSPISYHFIPLGLKYCHQHPVLKHPESYVLPLIIEIKFYTHIKPQKKIVALNVLIFTFLICRGEDKRDSEVNGVRITRFSVL